MSTKKRQASAKKAVMASMVAAGENPKAVAAKLGVTPTQVTRATVEVVRSLGLLGPSTVEEARKVLAGASQRAAARMVEIVESDDEQAALKAAGSILDRVGIGAKSQLQVDVRRLGDAELEAEALEAARLLLGENTDAAT